MATLPDLPSVTGLCVAEECWMLQHRGREEPTASVPSPALSSSQEYSRREYFAGFQLHDTQELRHRWVPQRSPSVAVQRLKRICHTLYPCNFFEDLKPRRPSPEHAVQSMLLNVSFLVSPLDNVAHGGQDGAVSDFMITAADNL